MSPPARFASGPLWAAIAVVLVWLALLIAFKPAPIADERLHMEAIGQIAAGQMPPAGQLGMLPAYHTLLGVLLQPIGASLNAARALTALLAIGALIATHLAARSIGAANTTVLHVALSPLFLPFAAMVYTEAAGLLCLMAGFAFHVRGHRLPAAISLAAACLFRQSLVVWVVIGIVWDAFGRPEPPESEPQAEARLRKIRGAAAWLVPPMLAVIAVYYAAGGIEVGGGGMNRVGLNPAQIHTAGAVFGLLWLPIWVEALMRDWRSDIQPKLMRPAVVTALIAIVAIIAMLFSNPHPWNNASDYLRNHLLTAMMRSSAVCAAVSALVVAAMLGLHRALRRQPQVRLIAATCVLSCIYIAPHWLVDPRYFLPPLLFLTVFFRPGRIDKVQLIWSGLLCTCLATYVLSHGGFSAGIW
ncbi:MAG: hypothetical protein HZB38_10905 [Planctomycetes bacterium]|nr:hypothetical protein [Planctomycetota bacterium]